MLKVNLTCTTIASRRQAADRNLIVFIARHSFREDKLTSIIKQVTGRTVVTDERAEQIWKENNTLNHSKAFNVQPSIHIT